MKQTVFAGAALIISGAAALAGGIDRSGQSTAVLFEQGRYGDFTLGVVSPSVSGVGGLLTPGAPSGDMAPTYFQFGAAYKADLNDTWSYALIYDQPFGADVSYPAGTGYFAGGSTAEFNSHALTGVLQYNMPSNVSLYGGVRLQAVDAQAVIPFIGPGYSVNGSRDFGVGYVIGAAFEKPEIALRIALTYNSKISHDLATAEVLGVPTSSTTNFDTPQSVNLEFQTGVAADTLVFGSVRWVDWSEFSIAPMVYTGAVGSPLVSFASDTITYTLGVGRRLNDQWSVAATIGFEDETDAVKSNLAPTDGQKSVGLAATYTRDNMKITGGIRYVRIGDAITTAGGATPAGVFSGNSAIAAGVKVGFTF